MRLASGFIADGIDYLEFNEFARRLGKLRRVGFAVGDRLLHDLELQVVLGSDLGSRYRLLVADVLSP